MSEVTQVIVFGATGKTGLQCLKRGIREGLKLTAFVRRPESLPDDVKSKLCKIIQGDVFDKDGVEEAIKGHDAVISTLGTGNDLGPTTVLSTGMKNITSGMRKHNVKKLVVVSSPLLYPSFSRSPLELFFRNLVQDHKRQADVLENDAKDLDWIAVTPPRIRDKDEMNDYVITEGDIPGGHTVTTVELGDLIVKLLVEKTKNEKYRQRFVGISSHPKGKAVPWMTILVGITAICVALYMLYYT